MSSRASAIFIVQRLREEGYEAYLAGGCVRDMLLGKTPHGEIATPVFMPVGTAGTVKAVTLRDLTELGAHIVLANTYHMILRPGDAAVAGLGGLHGFTGWSRAFLTDSGGYQVFSLSGLRRLSERGVVFRTNYDHISNAVHGTRGPMRWDFLL